LLFGGDCQLKCRAHFARRLTASRMAAAALFSACVVIPSLVLGQDDSGWITVYDWRPSAVQGVSMKLKCQSSIHQFNLYLRNDSSSPLSVGYAFGDSGDGGAMDLQPGQIKGGGNYGAWTMASSCQAVPNISVSLDTASQRATSRAAVATPEVVDGAMLDYGSVLALRNQANYLKAAHAITSLLAWSPLLSIAGDTNTLSVQVSVGMTDWAQLASGISNVDRLTLLICAGQSQTQARRYQVGSEGYLFWMNMYDVYMEEADRHKS
jgi:hypothetical protein